MSAEEILKKYNIKLCLMLPLDDPKFLEILENHDILPGNSRDKVQREKEQTKRVDYYIQHVIKASADLYLPKLLEAMKIYNNENRNSALQDLIIHMIADINSNKKLEVSELHRHIVPKYAARWRDLGVQLKIPDHHLNTIAVNNTNHPSYSEQCCKAMLQKWMETTPDATWNMLQTAIDCLHNSLHDDLPHSSTCESPPSQRMKYEHSKELLLFRKHIELTYINTRYNIQTELWKLLHPKHFVNVLLIHHIGHNREKEIFDTVTTMQHGLVSQKYILPWDKHFTIQSKSKQSLKSTKTNTISNIFLPYENSDGSTTVPKYILIEGAPGMGKTTLCKEIAYRWAKQGLLKDIKLVFLVYLRDPNVIRIKNLIDLVRYLYNFDESAAELSKQCAQELIARDNSDVMIILDGYDEFNSSEHSLITDIMSHKVLPQSRIVVTSRLTASDKLHRMADVRVEILGFTDESKTEYIKEELRGFPSRMLKLKFYLRSHPAINSICYMPIMMTILVYVFKEKEDLPNDPTELYQKFLALTISHHLQKQSKTEHFFVSLHSLPTDHEKYLLDLSKFAFLILKSNKRVFSNEDIINLCPYSILANNSLENFGIVVSVQYFSTDKGNSHAFSFLHSSIQEYLSAYYISSIDQHKQFNELEATFLDEQYKETWSTFITINKKHCLICQNYLIYCKDEHHEELSSCIADFNNISEVQRLLELSIKIIYSNTITNDHIQLLFKINDKFVYVYHYQFYLSFGSIKFDLPKVLEIFLLDRNLMENWKKLCNKVVQYNSLACILIWNNDLFGFKINWEQVIKCLKLNVSFYQVTLRDCYITNSTVDAIMSHISNFCDMRHVTLNNCSFEQGGFTRLSRVLNKITAPWYFDVFNINFTKEDVDGLVSIILNNCNLEVLCLWNSNFEGGVTKFAEASQQTFQNLGNKAIIDEASTVLDKVILSKNTFGINSKEAPAKSIYNLEKLLMHHNKLRSSAITFLQSLITVSTLKTINIDSSKVTEEASKALASVILHNTGLEELHLYNTNLKSSAIVILQSLHNISTLKILNINDNHMPPEAGKALASVVLHNTELRELHLRNNNLDEETVKVVQALQHITSLRKLNLSKNFVSKEGSYELALAIKSNKYLKELWLHDNYLKYSAIFILQSLSTISTLKLLNMVNNQITEEAGEALASVVLNNTKLEELYLSGNNLGVGLLIVMNALQHITSLRMLSLGNNSISKEVSIELAYVIKSNKHLQKLWLHNSNLGSSAIIILQSLSTISTLKFLNMNKNQITEEAGEALASVILHNTGLEELHLSGNSVGEGLVAVTKGLKCVTSLTYLDLGNNNVSTEAASELALAIKSNKHLIGLCMYNSNLKSSVTVVLQSLSTISTLKSLILNDNQITEEAGEALASVVVHNTRLEELHVSGNNLGKGMLTVAKALQHISSLRSLDLGNNNISEVAGELALAISANECLEEMRLYNSKLTSSAIVILQSLSTIATLKYLNINNNQITEEAGEALASVVLHNTRLEELHVSGNNLGKGMLTVAKALQHISSLRSLNLGNNNISEEVAGELALAITSNEQLEELYLFNTNLQSSAMVILQALSSISSLKVIYMNNNYIGNNCGEMFSHVIQSNAKIEKLNLQNNYLQEGAMKVLKTLQSILNLSLLDLSNNILLEAVGFDLATVIQSNNSLNHLGLQNNNLRMSMIKILQALYSLSNLQVLNAIGNTIAEEAEGILASIITKNIKLHSLSLSLLISPLKVIEAFQNLSVLQSLVFDTCNISKEMEIKIAHVITNNKSLYALSLANITLSQNVIPPAIETISNLTFLWLEDNLLSEEVSDHLSLAVRSNRSLQKLILLDNMLQTGLIKIAIACNKLSNAKVLQLAHNCIIPNKVVELTSLITQNTSLERVLLGGITLNAAECFHYNINEVLHKTTITCCKSSCVVLFDDCTYLEVIYLEMLRKQIDNEKKCLDNISIYENAKNFSFAQKIHHYFKGNRITQMNGQEAKEKLTQINTRKMISSLYILEKVKVIDLENNNIDEGASFELATALHSNNVLEQLWLRGNKLNTAGALYILNSLEYLTTLQVLDISYNNIGSQSADGIAAVIDNNPLINQLWLDGNDLHSTGTITICNALKKIRRLSILSLCNNRITDDAADELSAVITQNVLLEDLLLSNNQLHSTGIKIIAESLSKLIKLRKLDLFNNNIGKEGANSLAIVIHNSPTLQDLFLSSNNLETSGALEICNALSYINSLHVLTLSNNNISDEVTSQLIEVLNNNHLYALLIGGNGLECGGLKIAQVIEDDNIAMQLLDFSNNNISEQDKEKIKDVFSKRANFKLYV